MSCTALRRCPSADNKLAPSRHRTKRRQGCAQWTAMLVLLLLAADYTQSAAEAYMMERLSRCSRSTTLSSTAALFSVSSKSIRVNGKSSSAPTVSASNELSSRKEAKAAATPRHVAFVCDGNSRWATARNLPSAAGHAAGANRLIEVIRAMQAISSVTHCTFYGFSTENWKRPASEIRDIFMVMEQTARRFYDKLLHEGVILKVIGDMSDERIPAGLREILQQLEQETQNKYANDATGHVVTLCLAINYGGRHDIINASKRLATRIADGTLDPNSLNEETFAACLDTADVPDPDLLIRTSGESRLSNFMLWNAAYAELYFTETLWPDFDANAVQAAFDWYAQRRRRFGAR
jgi:undecaprenyl diphosphate synthase